MFPHLSILSNMQRCSSTYGLSWPWSSLVKGDEGSIGPWLRAWLTPRAKNKKILLHMNGNIKIFWLLGRSGCSSLSTKELHVRTQTWVSWNGFFLHFKCALPCSAIIEPPPHRGQRFSTKLFFSVFRWKFCIIHCLRIKQQQRQQKNGHCQLLTVHKSSHSLSQKTNNGFTFRETVLVNRFCQMEPN